MWQMEPEMKIFKNVLTAKQIGAQITISFNGAVNINKASTKAQAVDRFNNQKMSMGAINYTAS